MKEPADVVSVYALGLSQTLRSLNSTPSELSAYEWIRFEQACLLSIRRVRTFMTPTILLQPFKSGFIPHIETLFARVHPGSSNPMIPNHILSQQSSSLRSLLKVRNLMNSFQYHFLCYLWRINHPIQDRTKNEEIGHSLWRVIQRLLNFLPQLSSRLHYEIYNMCQIGVNDFARPMLPFALQRKDADYCFLYFALTLIDNGLFPQDSPASEANAIMSAIYVCRTYASDSYRSSVVDLIVSGLILTKTRHSDGRYPLFSRHLFSANGQPNSLTKFLRCLSC